MKPGRPGSRHDDRGFEVKGRTLLADTASWSFSDGNRADLLESQ